MEWWQFGLNYYQTKSLHSVTFAALLLSFGIKDKRTFSLTFLLLTGSDNQRQITLSSWLGRKHVHFFSVKSLVVNCSKFTIDFVKD